MFDHVMHFFDALLHLRSFDHGQCDALLTRQRATIPMAFQFDKVSSQRDTVYSSWIFLLFALVLVVGLIRKSSSAQYEGTWAGNTRFGPFIVLAGVIIMMALQVAGTISYIDTCRALLSKA